MPLPSFKALLQAPGASQLFIGKAHAELMFITATKI